MNLKSKETELKKLIRHDVALSIYKHEIGFGDYDWAAEKSIMSVRKMAVKTLRAIFDKKKSDAVIVRYLRYVLWATKSFK